MDCLGWMLMMYLRYADQLRFKTDVVDIQNDTLAGIRAAQLSSAESIRIIYAVRRVCIDCCAYHRLLCGRGRASFAAVEADLGITLRVNIDLGSQD